MIDPHHFEACMKAYQYMVFTTAVRLLGNEAEAEDISQEVFLKAYERFENLGPSPTAGGWLKTVTRNLCLNHLSRYRGRWRFFSEMDSGEDNTHFIDGIPAAEAFAPHTEGPDQRRLLEEALRQLSPAQRIPLVLYHFEELGYEEIAVKMGISLSKVKTDIHRGRAELYRKLRMNADGEVQKRFDPRLPSPTDSRAPRMGHPPSAP